MKTKFNTAIFIAIMVLAISCEKSELFPNGGEVDQAEENIRNSWTLTSYLRDDVNETNLVLISDYVETYNSEGVYSRSYTESDQTLVTESGVFNFTESLLELKISDVSSISNFSENNSTLSSSTYLILKLTENEFWYSFVNGSEKHEFRFSVKQPM